MFNNLTFFKVFLPDTVHSTGDTAGAQTLAFLMVLFMVFSCGKTDNNQINKVVVYQSVKSAMKKEHHITGGATLDKMVRTNLFDVVKFKQRREGNERGSHKATLGNEQR